MNALGKNDSKEDTSERPRKESLIEREPLVRKGYLELIKLNRQYITICFAGLFVGFFLMLMRGGRGFESLVGIGLCSFTYWILLVFTQVLLVSLEPLFRRFYYGSEEASKR